MFCNQAIQTLFTLEKQRVYIVDGTSIQLGEEVLRRPAITTTL